MFQRIKRFFGLDSTPPTPNQPPYPQNNIYGPPLGPPYFIPPYGLAPWMYTTYPGDQAAGNNQAGVRRLYRFQRETEMLYAAILDTRERLEAIEKIEGEFNTLNAALTDAERWDAVNSAPSPVHAPHTSPKSTPPTPLSRQSYRWDGNSCFIDAPLEALFRAFIAMGDATRKEFLRRIRVEAPDTGLRYVVEHLWLRGLLSGSIASSRPTTKNSTRPDKKKLVDALLAGQLNVKNLIETKWDGGVFSAGMASCSRTWMNQMVNTDTTRGVQKYFGICRAVNYSCGARHSVTKPTPWISVENGIRHDDLLIAQKYLPRDSHRLSSLTISSMQFPGSAPEHRVPQSGQLFISHLRFLAPIPHPIQHSNNMRDEPLVTDLFCPLTLNLGFDVEYILIARIIFIPPAEGEIGHYVTKTRLKDSTYLYNDLHNNGLLTELGPLHILEDHDPGTSFVVYLRTSMASTTSRTVGEIEFDYASIPAPPPADPILVLDDSDDEIGQMLIDSITTPSKNTSIGPSISPLPPSSDRFFTPEESPAPPPSNKGHNMPTDFPDSDSMTPSVPTSFCCQDELDAKLFVPNQVVMLPHPDAQDWKAPDTVWYPARFIEHHKNRKAAFNEYELRWLECNDGTVYYSSFSNLPVLMLRTIYRSRKFLKEVQDVQITENQIGNICLPFYMKPDDPNHKNPTLTAIFDAALPLVAEILASWNNGHPVIRSFETFFIEKKKHARAREADNWMRTLGLHPTPELEAVLTDPLMHLMGHDALLGITQQECNIRVMGVGSVLFQLLAVQHELGEPLDLNGDLIEDLKDDNVVVCWPDGDAALNAMFSAIPTTSTKSGVLVQQLLAFKRDHTIFDKEFRPPTFRRDRPSHFPPTVPIPVVVNDTSKRKKNEEVDAEKPAKRVKVDPKKARKGSGIAASKRRGDDEIDKEKPTKRARAHQREAQEDVSKSTKKQPTSRPTT
ncbi:hypothetical protein C8J57DRAFT_1675521 [Mycena rebaudengoi]|nr:hypothetical protein C8J57DRAFT_1675521 [Mycena rebaudengoi]